LHHKPSVIIDGTTGMRMAHDGKPFQSTVSFAILSVFDTIDEDRRAHRKPRLLLDSESSSGNDAGPKNKLTTLGFWLDGIVICDAHWCCQNDDLHLRMNVLGGYYHD